VSKWNHLQGCIIAHSKADVTLMFRRIKVFQWDDILTCLQMAYKHCYCGTVLELSEALVLKSGVPMLEEVQAILILSYGMASLHIETARSEVLWTCLQISLCMLVQGQYCQKWLLNFFKTSYSKLLNHFFVQSIVFTVLFVYGWSLYLLCSLYCVILWLYSTVWSPSVV
jgi:hypothetical protein